MGKDRVGQPEVAFGIFKVDGVHFVRHGGRTHFASYGFLLEIATRTITADIPVKVDHDGVKANQRVEQLGNVLAGLELRGVGVPYSPDAFYDLLRTRGPANMG